ncbi:MAG: hypothetical protein ACXAC8_12005 [Candidatus Hodarchaeales archaeon]|jgi:hypothetical protein
MLNQLDELNEIVRFEPILIDLLDDINEQHSRILVMMFRLGGFTTLNVLTDYLSFAQPTVSIRVAELVNKGYLRKNTELMPMALVLLLSISDLKFTLNKRFEAQQNAVRFLQKVSKIRNKHVIMDTFVQAMHILHPKEEKLARMIAFTYLYQFLSRDELYQLVGFFEKEPEKITIEYDSIIASHNEIFHVAYRKHQKKEMFVQPRFPLNLFMRNKLVYLESLNQHYQSLLEELGNFMTGEYMSIIPHQLLNYPSEVKLKVETCLKHYSDIKIIDNSIYQNKEGTEGILNLITNRQQFSSDHKVMVLANNEVSIPKSVDQSQIEHNFIRDELSRDYKSRDFVIFGEHGCLVFPSQPNAVPYYNIAPMFTTNVLKIFKSNWRK